MYRVRKIIAMHCTQVHYCGTLDDDSVFDSSHEREPLDFIVGTGKVIPGFDDVVIGMARGERRKERVEPNRAYGRPQAVLQAVYGYDRRMV